MNQLSYQLPGGYIDDTGQLHREVELTALTGREEELLVKTASQGAAVQVTSVLACCVKRLGDIAPVNENHIRQLLVGDRQYLMMKLRELTFGDRVQAIVSCPWPECDTRVDIDFKLSDIPVKALDHISSSYQLQSKSINPGEQSQVEFRLPNGGDQEALWRSFSNNEAEFLSLLLWRCVQSIDGQVDPDLEKIKDLPLLVRKNIEQRMEELAPDVELTMEAVCPECERNFTIPFDLQEFFFGELNTSRELLRREIHYLAYHYHWSENDILEMSREKRREYIEILADEIERMNEGVRHGAVG